jgi:hypothetical protein
MENTELSSYTEATIIQAQIHLEFIRGMIDLREDVDILSFKVTGQMMLEEFNKILYFNSLVTISRLDVAIILKNMLCAKFDWERMYFIKQAHLTIHETLETYKNHAKSLKELVKSYPQLDAIYKKMNIDLRSFRSEYAVETEMREIRNWTAGHIDEDFKKYYDTLLKIDANKTLEMMSEFINMTDSMFAFSVQAIEIDTPGEITPDKIESMISDMKSKLLEKMAIIQNKITNGTR